MAEEALCEWLHREGYRQGDWLAPERDLAAALGVSRGTLRKALQRLSERGEIVRRPGSGTYLATSDLRPGVQRRGVRAVGLTGVVVCRSAPLRAVAIELRRCSISASDEGEWGFPARTEAVTIFRTLASGGEPVAVVFDVVRSDVALPTDDELLAALRGGAMLGEVLCRARVAVSAVATKVRPRLIGAREPVGRMLCVAGATAGLEVDEVLYTRRGQRLAVSREVFVPTGLEVRVTRAIDRRGAGR